MARTLRWTEAAAQDLAAAADFIARAAAQTLKTLAERGRVVPEAGSSEVREIFVKSYRLIYKVGPSSVTILAFVHSARNLRGGVHSIV